MGRPGALSTDEKMRPQVALLTGGGDRPYALGLAHSLADAGVTLDFIGSDFLESPELRACPLVRVLNLRGDMSPEAPVLRKFGRVLRYYLRLIRYAAVAEPGIFHILWNNRFEIFDRTLLLAYYRLCGRRLVMTVHNVNIRKRDGNDSLLNRVTLKLQYRACDHLFVHTERMKQELQTDFAVPPEKVSVIPFGINSTVPQTDLSCSEARARLGFDPSDQVVLFFGNIAPYKGLEYLIEAMGRLRDSLPRARLIIAGRPKGSEAYWERLHARIQELSLRERTLERIEYIPDEDTEIYFKAADVLVLPYTHVFQSGVLFLGYNFGLPVIASDVASMKEDIIEGETGFVFRPADPDDLAQKLSRFFTSPLYRELETRRPGIRQFAAERYSWTKVAAITRAVYAAVAAGLPHRTDEKRLS